LRLLGVREIVSGIGILTNRQPSGWLRSRVAGDAMDLAGLGTSLFVKGSQRGRLALTTAAVAGVTALDVMASRRLSRRPGANVTAVHVQRSVLVARTPEALYQFWKDFEKLPQFMTHLTNVTKLDERRSHWVAKAPAGAKAEWDAEIIEDKPNELIAWRSLPGADVEHAGPRPFSIPASGRRLGGHPRALVWRGSRKAGRRGSAPLQAANGNRRDASDRRPACGSGPLRIDGTR
jgi:uncharacterized membrane protein